MDPDASLQNELDPDLTLWKKLDTEPPEKPDSTQIEKEFRWLQILKENWIHR